MRLQDTYNPPPLGKGLLSGTATHFLFIYMREPYYPLTPPPNSRVPRTPILLPSHITGSPAPRGLPRTQHSATASRAPTSTKRRSSRITGSPHTNTAPPASRVAQPSNIHPPASRVPTAPHGLPQHPTGTRAYKTSLHPSRVAHHYLPSTPRVSLHLRVAPPTAPASRVAPLTTHPPTHGYPQHPTGNPAYQYFAPPASRVPAPTKHHLTLHG